MTVRGTNASPRFLSISRVPILSQKLALTFSTSGKGWIRFTIPSAPSLHQASVRARLERLVRCKRSARGLRSRAAKLLKITFPCAAGSRAAAPSKSFFVCWDATQRSAQKMHGFCSPKSDVGISFGFVHRHAQQSTHFIPAIRFPHIC